MTRMTRRQALAGAGAGVVLAGVGGWGRHAFGDNFEDHVGGLLGVDPRVAAELVESLRGQLGADYEPRAAGFVLATTAPARWLMPGQARRAALEAFIGPLVGLEDQLVTPFALSGLRDTGRYAPCGVLYRP